MRLMPQPPALEDSRNTNCPGSPLNCCTILVRFFRLVLPSRRSTGYCAPHHGQCKQTVQPILDMKRYGTCCIAWCNVTAWKPSRR